MHTGPHNYNAFCSYIVVDGNILVEQSADAQVEEDPPTPSQHCYIIAKPNQAFGIHFKFHNHHDKMDHMVVCRVDGTEIARVIIKMASHVTNIVDSMVIGETDAEGVTVTSAQSLVFSQLDEAIKAHGIANTVSVEAGKIVLEVYRGSMQASAPTKPRPVEYKCPKFGRGKKPSDPLCIIPGPRDGASSEASATRASFIPRPKDKGKPWFTHVFEYRTLSDLESEELTECSPDAEPQPIAPKGAVKARAARVGAVSTTANSNTAALESRLARLEQTIQTYFRGRGTQDTPFEPRPEAGSPTGPLSRGMTKRERID